MITKTFRKFRKAGKMIASLGVSALTSAILTGTAAAEPVEIIIEGNDRMQYDTQRFAVDPGQEVRLTLRHVGEMPVEAMGHNVVILANPDANAISFGQLVQTKGGNLENDYLPEAVRDQVIAFTEMIGGGETATVTFTAPKKPGEYPYLCSFPLHASLMRGVMEVKGEVTDNEAENEIEAPEKISEVLPEQNDFPDRSELKFDPDAVPEMAEGFEATIWVREPALLHPSALAFGRKGRLYVGGGPQYRDPDKDSPKDSIWVVEDKNGDGEPDDIKIFATGLNSVQGLAWRNEELWVANPPDLTVLRDTDDDLKADEYVKVYTHLGHLRHGLHGLNWAPDGRLYMSQGNSEVQDGAPEPFRELHRIDSDKPDNQPLNKVYTPENYEADFIDNWPSAPHGGYLRANAQGHHLEIFARGNRNPWDMAFDGGFNWLGNDQDPGDAGDKLLMVFEGAHYGMGHPRGTMWTGDDNSAVVPPSYHFTRYQKNSLVGMKYYLHDHFPENYRDAFFVNDWVNRNIYVFRPTWDGAMMKDGGNLEEFADGGTHSGGELLFTPGEGDPLFRPTDLEIGPSGAMYVASWGTQYGSRWAPYIGGDAEAKVHWGRVFRIHYAKGKLTPREEWYTAKRDKPYEDWSTQELIADLGAQVRVWRTDAQNELVRRGQKAKSALLSAIRSGKLSQMAETYAVWALGRIGPDAARFGNWVRGDDGAGLNRRIQAIRIVGDQGLSQAASAVADQLADAEPRIRFAAAQALRHLQAESHVDEIVAALPDETDELCFYTQWNALRALASKDRLREIAAESRSVNVQGAVLLALGPDAELDAAITPPASGKGVKPAQKVLRDCVEVRVQIQFTPDSRHFRKPIKVQIAAASDNENWTVRYAFGDEKLSADSPEYRNPVKITESAHLRAAVFEQGKQIGPVSEARYDWINDAEWAKRLTAIGLKTGTKNRYKWARNGLTDGAKLFTDRDYVYESVPKAVKGAMYLRTANDDSNVDGSEHIRFTVNKPATVYVAYDSRADDPPAWLSERGFKKTDLSLDTTDVTFNLFKKNVRPGEVVLGGNRGASSMYQVILVKQNPHQSFKKSKSLHGEGVKQ